jgi:hypothetical protein
MNSSTLTPAHQNRVTRAREFLAATMTDEPAFDLGAAKQHMRYLLEVIADLTDGAS